VRVVAALGFPAGLAAAVGRRGWFGPEDPDAGCGGWVRVRRAGLRRWAAGARLRWWRLGLCGAVCRLRGAVLRPGLRASGSGLRLFAVRVRGFVAGVRRAWGVGCAVLRALLLDLALPLAWLPAFAGGLAVVTWCFACFCWVVRLGGRGSRRGVWAVVPACSWAVAGGASARVRRSPARSWRPRVTALGPVVAGAAVARCRVLVAAGAGVRSLVCCARRGRLRPWRSRRAGACPAVAGAGRVVGAGVPGVARGFCPEPGGGWLACPACQRRSGPVLWPVPGLSGGQDPAGYGQAVPGPGQAGDRPRQVRDRPGRGPGRVIAGGCGGGEVRSAGVLPRCRRGGGGCWRAADRLLRGSGCCR
jgi:hypothetical protein